MGAVRVDPKVVQHDLARSAISTGDPSWPTRNVLFERGLFDAFDARPEDPLAELHRTMVGAGGDPNLLFALAELSFLHGQAARKPEYDPAAASQAARKHEGMSKTKPACTPGRRGGNRSHRAVAGGAKAGATARRHTVGWG